MLKVRILADDPGSRYPHIDLENNEKMVESSLPIADLKASRRKEYKRRTIRSLGWRPFTSSSKIFPLITIILFTVYIVVSSSYFEMLFNKATTVALGLLTQQACAGILPKRDVWQPSVASKWQIVIKNNISVSLQDTLQPADVGIWDLDLFNTPVDVISGLHNLGKKVICYFSAGSGENWRPDYSEFPAADLGEDLGCWPGEKWLNVKSEAVWDVMAKRIALASQKGCDGVDPDNMGKTTLLSTLKEANVL
jgi:hypothetical protein